MCCCNLFRPVLKLAEDYRDKCIDEVLDGIRAIAPDIAILEI